MARFLAEDVQAEDPERLVPRPAVAPRSMNRDFQIRFTASLLALLTAAAIVLSAINFRKEQEFQAPYDGAWWVERSGTLVADRVAPNGPAARAGIKVGDQLTAVDEHDVNSVAKLSREQYRVGPWSKGVYSVVRQGVPV